MTSILIVRLGSLGDIVHALPVAYAVKALVPDARVDWLVDVRHRPILELVPVVDGIVAVDTRASAWPALVRQMGAVRRGRYDVAVDLQGLLKSAVLARASGARRVVGFSRAHLREPIGAGFYTDRCAPDGARHVIEKNLAVLPLVAGRSVGRFPDAIPGFPLTLSSIGRSPSSAAQRVGSSSDIVARVRQVLDPTAADSFALINPGAAWPNKRWPPDRFGAISAALFERRRWRSIVLWGPGEETLAREVVAHSHGAASVSPPTSIADLVALAQAAGLMVSGDTGPLHLAAAAGAPIVGLYGPTNPARNGPWAPGDRTCSRFEQCLCHHERRCRRATPCIAEIPVAEVLAAIDDRLREIR